MSDLLLIEIDPQVSAMAGAGAGFFNNAGAYNINPAGVGYQSKKEIGAGYLKWFGGVNFLYLSGRTPVSPDISIGANIFYRGLSFKQTDEWGLETDKDVDITSYIENISFSARIIKNFYGGIGIKFIQDYLADYSASFQVLDIGFLYRWEFLSAGFSVLNNSLGGSIIYLSDEMTVQSTKRIGIGALFLKDRLGVACDLLWGDALELRGKYGIEYHFGKLVTVRLGYDDYYGRNFNFSDGICAGMGVHWKNLFIDYSWLNGGDLTSDNTFLGINGISRIGMKYVF